VESRDIQNKVQELNKEHAESCVSKDPECGAFACRDVYEEGAGLLSEIEDGRLDARLLLEHYCGIPAHRLLSHPETVVDARDREAFLGGIRRRAAREPLAYIIGEQSFMGLPFVVSRDVLIPEQDTENMVEEALRYLEDRSRILDLCTGSGCILLSLLHYTNNCVGVGTDLSGPALEIARRNAEALGLSDCADWMQGDLFEALSQRPETEKGISDSGISDNTFSRPVKYDMIISNPPYIRTEVIETLAPEVRCAEPRLALDGGADGLDFYRRIIRQAPAYLVIGGRLMVEIGYDQAADVTALFEEAGYYGIEVIKDYGGNDRIVTAVRSMKQEAFS
jgi:release factor glutamine methyltransferase